MTTVLVRQTFLVLCVGVQGVDRAAKFAVLEAGEVWSMNARRVGVEDVCGHRPKMSPEVDGTLQHDQSPTWRIDSGNSQQFGVEALAPLS